MDNSRSAVRSAKSTAFTRNSIYSRREEHFHVRKKGIVILMETAWIIPLFPLASFVFLLIFGKRLKESSAYVGMLMTFASLIFALLVLFDRFSSPTYKAETVWLSIGDLHLTAGFEVNQLNALMLFVVSLVSFLVHMYSKGYMQGDDRFHIFYAYLGLFTFAMLGLVVSPNLLQTYIFWELVGLGSFLLIGFYFYKEEAKAAAKKAFIMTRIGDVGLLHRDDSIILASWKLGIRRNIFGGGRRHHFCRDDYINGLCSSSSVLWVNQVNSRSIHGFLMRWKVRRLFQP